jgi:hypothetical protein
MTKEFEERQDALRGLMGLAHVHGGAPAELADCVAIPASEHMMLRRALYLLMLNIPVCVPTGRIIAGFDKHPEREARELLCKAGLVAPLLHDDRGVLTLNAEVFAAEIEETL